ncbi:response regulator (plasmid) [Rhizobium sp. WSM1274]|uniref:response regulator n=1 Tax=Rhizobium sp. WSM1274 TaxID=3138254 RepID=UPI0021A4B4F6|nr:response regulator [Rhizobium leguminosarum]UWU31004.1 response regulator [Rhizobium leguminosarum bv. viciae]
MQVQFDDALDQPTSSDAYPPPREATRGSFDDAIRFGRFRAVPHSRQLLLDGRPQEIGGRAFDLLMVLLKSKGRIVSKDEILNEVWPSMVVEECNLRFQVKSLRRALGSHGNLIKTIVRRGYMLIRDDMVCENEPRFDAMRSIATSVATKAATPHIVLIEDDESVRRSISTLLRSVGLDIAAFESVKEYQESGHADQPDCLILDVCLPGRSGLDFQADLLKTGMRYPIIFISGHADIQMSVRAMKAGAFEFLTKPVRHQDLLTAVDMAINA